jgi:glycosyltransferase involved in cell wall biosynthesis
VTRPAHWLVLASHIPPGGGLGGVVRYTAELMRAMAARDDVVLSAVTTRRSAATVAELVGDAGRVHALPDLPTAALSVAERYLPLRGRSGDAAGPVDVVWGPKHLLPRSMRAGGPVGVLTVHDMLLFDRAADYGGAKGVLLGRPYLASIRQADVCLCVSEATRARLLHHVPSAKPAVTPLATAVGLREAVPEPVPTLAGKRFALVVGDATPRKNLGTLVDSWAAVRAVVPDAVLAVVGPPSWGRTEQGEAYERLRAAGALVALGHVPDAQLAWAYTHAAVVACPSLVEGFGLPAAEAVALGAPLVTSDDPALREASGGRALAAVPATDGPAWVAALTRALQVPWQPRTPAAAPRTWDDVAADTVAAVSAVPAVR